MENATGFNPNDPLYIFSYNEQNWRTILAFNDQLKQTAQPWPESCRTWSCRIPRTDCLCLPTSAAYLQYGDVVVLFAGDMGELGFSVDNSADQSLSGGESVDMSLGVDLSVGGGVTVVGVGLLIESDWSFSTDQSRSTDTERGVSGSNSLSFSLSDSDLKDSFDVAIRCDTYYGAPVFVTTAGKSRCKAEANTVAREQLELQFSSECATQQQPANPGFSHHHQPGTLPRDLRILLQYLCRSQPSRSYSPGHGMELYRNAVLFKTTLWSDQVTLTITASNPQNWTNVTIPFTLTGVCYGDVVSVESYAFNFTRPLTLKYVTGATGSWLLPIWELMRSLYHLLFAPTLSISLAHALGAALLAVI